MVNTRLYVKWIQLKVPVPSKANLNVSIIGVRGFART
jgi:hypothetical protein